MSSASRSDPPALTEASAASSSLTLASLVWSRSLSDEISACAPERMSLNEAVSSSSLECFDS